MEVVWHRETPLDRLSWNIHTYLRSYILTLLHYFFSSHNKYRCICEYIKRIISLVYSLFNNMKWDDLAYIQTYRIEARSANKKVLQRKLMLNGWNSKKERLPEYLELNIHFWWCAKKLRWQIQEKDSSYSWVTNKKRVDYNFITLWILNQIWIDTKHVRRIVLHNF